MNSNAKKTLVTSFCMVPSSAYHQNSMLMAPLIAYQKKADCNVFPISLKPKSTSDNLDQEVKKTLKAERVKSGRHAALRRHQRNDPVKREAARLIQDHPNKPPSGWKSIASAASVISPSLADFIATGNFTISPLTIETRVLYWMRDEKNPLRTLYIENASPKALEKLTKR